MDYNTRASRAIQDKNCVGLITRLYGKGGELVVKLLDTFPEQADLLWIVNDQIATPLFISSITSQGASKAVVIFEDFESEELANQLVGKKIYAENIETEAVEDNELGFLVGMDFEDTTSTHKGRIVEVIESEFNSLINVDFGAERGQILIPLAEPLIEKIDTKRGKLTMCLIEGFFENFG